MTTLPPQDEDKMSELIEILEAVKRDCSAAGYHGALDSLMIPQILKQAEIALGQAIDALQSSAAREEELRKKSDEAFAVLEYFGIKQATFGTLPNSIKALGHERDQLRGVKGEPVAPDYRTLSEKLGEEFEERLAAVVHAAHNYGAGENLKHIDDECAEEQAERLRMCVAEMMGFKV